MLYSVVIPCYRSDQTIEHVVDQTREEMVRLGRANVEFVLVNDCSPDGGKTIQVLRKMAAERRDVKVIDLARNSGQHNALMAALRHADGDVIIGMDDDGQTHPSQLGKLFETFDQGYDLVYGYYPEKKHNWFRNLGSKFNDLTINMMINKPKDVRTSSYFLVRKFVRDYAIQYKGSYTYLLGLFMRCTQNIASVPIRHFEREGIRLYTGTIDPPVVQRTRIFCNSAAYGIYCRIFLCRCGLYHGDRGIFNEIHAAGYVYGLAISDVCHHIFLRTELYVPWHDR